MTVRSWIEGRLSIDLAAGEAIDPADAWALILSDEPCPHGSPGKRIYEASCCQALRRLLARHEFASFRSALAGARRQHA